MSSALTGISTSSAVVSSSANTYTVVQQGSQQILVPASSLKSFQGLKVIPLSQHNLKGLYFCIMLVLHGHLLYLST